MNSDVHIGDNLFTYYHKLNEVIDLDIWATNRYIKEPDHFYYTLIYKLRSLLDPCSFLVRNIENKPHYIDATYLILRTCLLDVVNLYFVFDQQLNSDVLDIRIKRIMVDHVRNLYTQGSQSDKEEIKKSFPQFFTGDRISPELGKVTIKTMVDEIANESLKLEATYAMNLYSILSKVEHNGIYSFQLLHNHYVGDGLKKAIQVVDDALTIIIICINTILLNWIKPEDLRYNEMTRLAKLIIH